MSSIRLTRTYPHPPAAVWHALTDATLLGRWLMPNDFEPRVGHRFTFRTEPGPGFDGIVHCEVLALEPGRRMVWSWRGGPLDTKVEFALEAVAGGTRLHLHHSGFRGLRAQIVRLILAIGSRSIYGRRLPAVLREQSPGAAAAPGQPDGAARADCMTPGQRFLAWLQGLLPRRRVTTNPGPRADA
jgi:uncharacterized protein YndB with AHSA1/START domain